MNLERFKLQLFKESWENLFSCIRDSSTKINCSGNFWASVQHLEAQLSDQASNPKKKEANDNAEDSTDKERSDN